MTKGEMDVIEAKGDVQKKEAVLIKYKNLLYFLTNKYGNYIYGMEKEDIYLELGIALMEAIDKYEPRDDAKFFTFLYVCLTRKIYNINRRESVKKRRKTIVGYLENPTHEGGYVYAEVLSDNMDIEYEIETKSKIKEVDDLAKQKLNKNEYEIYTLKMQGFSHKEVACFKKMTSKQLSNQMYRIRMKMKNKLE